MCCEHYCHFHCRECEEEKVSIPLIYIPQVMIRNEKFWNLSSEKIKPSDHLTLEKISQKDLETVRKAIKILSRHGVYYFQEK